VDDNVEISGRNRASFLIFAFSDSEIELFPRGVVRINWYDPVEES
jgi:hypothetical protein